MSATAFIIEGYALAGRTATHQMTMNGKRDGFALADVRACAKTALMKRGRAEAIVQEVRRCREIA